MKAKYKIGDKVKIREDLIKDTEYFTETKKEDDKIYCMEGMLHYAGKDAVIENIKADTDNVYYELDIDNRYWNWACEMFEGKVKKTKSSVKANDSFLEDCIKILQETNKENNQFMQNLVEKFTDNVNAVNKSITKISNSLNTRTIYDEEIINTIKERINKMPTKDLENTIKNETDKYIKKNYGTLPQKIEIKIDNNVKKIDGLFHNKFEEILKIIQRGVPLMLTGPAGAGKNHTLEQVANALDLDFYFTNAVTQEYKLTGFIDANGVYQETQFYKAFKDGGLFFLDEIDASCPEALIILNSAIANGYFDFPNGKVEVNKNFRVACAGNTYGTGADMVYVGRNALDGATLDRFVTINFGYDEDIERQLAYDEELFNFIKDLRQAINKNSLRYIVSMRATINATKLLEIDMDKKDILKNVIIKNMQIDDLNIIINKIKMDNEWAELLKAYVNARN